MKNKQAREKERERERILNPRDRAARKVCPNDKRISAVIKGTCQISLHSRGVVGCSWWMKEIGRG